MKNSTGEQVSFRNRSFVPGASNITGAAVDRSALAVVAAMPCPQAGLSNKRKSRPGISRAALICYRHLTPSPASSSPSRARSCACC